MLVGSYRSSQGDRVVIRSSFRITAQKHHVLIENRFIDFRSAHPNIFESTTWYPLNSFSFERAVLKARITSIKRTRLIKLSKADSRIDVEHHENDHTWSFPIFYPGDSCFPLIPGAFGELIYLLSLKTDFGSRLFNFFPAIVSDELNPADFIFFIGESSVFKGGKKVTVLHNSPFGKNFSINHISGFRDGELPTHISTPSRELLFDLELNKKKIFRNLE